MSKVVALGGKHRSAQSLLAEMMVDEEIKSCVVMGFTADNVSRFAHFDVTRQQMAYAACIFQSHAVEGEDDK